MVRRRQSIIPGDVAEQVSDDVVHLIEWLLFLGVIVASCLRDLRSFRHETLDILFLGCVNVVLCKLHLARVVDLVADVHQSLVVDREYAVRVLCELVERE